MADNIEDIFEDAEKRGDLTAKAAARLKNEFRETKKELEGIVDLADMLVNTFKRVNGIGEGMTKNLQLQASFAKTILSDTMAREMIEDQFERNIGQFQRDLIESKLEEINAQEDLVNITAEYADSIDDINDLINSGIDLQDTLIKKQEEINDIKKRELSNATALQIIEEQIKNNQQKEMDVSEQLKALEAEMNAAQLSAIHDGIDLTAEYNAMTEKRANLLEKEKNIRVRGHYIQLKVLKSEQEYSDLIEEKNRREERGNRLNFSSTTALKEQELILGAIKVDNASKAVDAAKEASKAAEKKIKLEQASLKQARLQAGYMAHMEKSQYSMLGPAAQIVTTFKQFNKDIKVIPLQFMILTQLIKSGVDRFVKLDEAAEKFRRETGFSNTQMVDLRNNAEAVNIELQEFGVNIEDAYAAAGALTEIFGNTALVSKEAMTNVALMSANLGVAAKDSAEVLATFQGLGGASQETAMNVMKVGAGLSEKAGVPFKKVMEDIASASGETLAMLGANPSKLMKASIAARALGTDMNKLVSAQSKLLDYSTSINSELEASALLGKSVSFQRARQLAYEGDIAGAAKSTLETVKRAGDFNKMNMYQRKALAAASGMDLKDLTKMMAVDEQRREIRRSGTPAQQAQLKSQEKTLKMLEKENDLSKKSLLDQNEAAIRQQKMQGLMTQLKNTLESIMVAVGDVLEPIITSLTTIIVPVFKIIAAILRVTIIPLLKLVAYPLESIGKLLAKGAETLNNWGSSIGKLKEEFKGFFAFFDTGFGSVVKFIAGMAGMGLFAFLLFGKTGASGLMSAVGKVFSFINPLNWVKNFKAAGTAVGGFFGKIKEGGISSLFNKSDSAEAAADKTSTVANKSKDIKSGTGIKDFLTSLAAGLKKMGGAGVAKGAFNLLIASPGLITIIPGAVLAGLIPKKAGDNIESFLTGLASGLKAMGTGRITGGAANLLLASVGLITIIPGALAAVVIGIIGKPIETGLKYLAKGIAYMGDTNVFKGALGIAAVGLSIIPFAFAMQMFSDVDWGAVGIGSLALIGFTAAAFGLGAILSSGVGAAIFGAGVIGIASLGLALIPFAAAALIAGAGVKMLGEGIASSVDPILRLSEIDLTKAALGIGAIGIALAAFGAGSASAGLGSFVGGLLGGDPIAKMEKLASIGDKLKITAESITSIAQATSQFKAMDAFSESVTKLATSLGKLNDQISETNILKFAALTAMTSTVAATQTSETQTQTQTSSGNMAGVEAKLDKLTDLLAGGAIRVYLDGKDVSSGLANSFGS